MTHMLSRIIRNKQLNTCIYQSVRFAGHSKWQNIKHIKASEDAKREAMFCRLRRAMAHAIREGGSPNPAENIHLSRVIERAKLAYMPAATIQRYLQNLTGDKSKHQMHNVEITGSGGYTMVVSYTTDSNIKAVNEIRARAKKYGAKVLENKTKNVFDNFCIIYAEKACSEDQAIEDAIVAGAEEVELIDEGGTKYFQFRVSPEEGVRASSKLKTLGYNISSMEDVHLPLTYITLDEADMKLVTGLKKKLEEMDMIEKVETNIEFTES